MTNTTIAPIVANKAGQIVANSRDVADFFGKQHFNVLQDIDRLVGAAPEAELNFQLCPYETAGGRSYRSFDMTRDGFTLLAMGFTGAKALQFKLRYIEAFNAMEAQLKAAAPVLPNFTDPAEAAIAWANEYKAKQIAQQRVAEVEAVVEEMKPLAQIGSMAADRKYSIAQWSRLQLPGVNMQAVKRDLLALGYLYQTAKGYRAYARHASLFIERVEDTYGTAEIFPTAKVDDR